MPLGFFATNPNVAQGVSAYNDALARAELGRMQEAVALTQAKLQADAQRDAMRQSYFQNQQANALEQQRLNQMGQYQQGQLTNQREATAAQMAWQKALSEANAAEAAKDREMKLKLGEMAAGRTAPSAADIEGSNNQATAMAGRLNFMLKQLRDAQAGEEKIVTDEFTKNMGGFTPFTFDSTFKARRDKALSDVAMKYRGQIQQLLQSVPADAPLDFDQGAFQFVPRIIRGAAQGTGSGSPAPASVAPQSKTDALIKEAQDAIKLGANPAAVQDRLQKMGIVLPGMASGFFGGGTNTANVWPPMQAAPVVQAPAPQVAPRILPIPDVQVAPRASYFGEQFPPQFNDLGRGYFQ